MSAVKSKDGTTIAYDRLGSGAAVILIAGGLDDGSENARLAAELARVRPRTTSVIRALAACANAIMTWSANPAVAPSRPSRGT